VQNATIGQRALASNSWGTTWLLTHALVVSQRFCRAARGKKLKTSRVVMIPELMMRACVSPTSSQQGGV
jgi:hypothetical protein